ncbi:uncharacterized protein (TIGR02302 family) [Rhodobium orientis]|nr:TIGR02302 family protein [Rhodobium orientis]MBB4303586.1 uncharacterized protein (TIGR02302 family) [Rhodobium orientis]
MRNRRQGSEDMSNGNARGFWRTVLGTGLQDRIASAVWRARATLFWEEAWPRLAHLLAVVALFLSVSWLGLWLVVPDWLRFALLGVFAGAAVFTLWRLAQLRWPDRAAGLSRVEHHSGLIHRPVTAVTDALASGRRDAASRALWELHQKRAAERLKKIAAGLPEPKLYRTDPYALRVLVAALFVIGFSVAGPDRTARLSGAFTAPAEEPGAGYRLDAWIDPPTYTSRVPIFLTREETPARDPDKPIAVPATSRFVARIQGEGDFAVSFTADGETADLAPVGEGSTPSASDAPAKPAEFHLELTRNGTITVRDGETERAAWTFAVEPDAKPEIKFTKDMETTVSRAMKLTYEATDDYGVVGAEATFAPVPDASKEGAVKDDAEDAATEPLIPAPKFPLVLSQRGGRKVGGETIRDLTAHPWAGSEVLMTLTARDIAGQTGTSEPVTITLPERPFGKPLARAIVEQRRILALDRDKQGEVVDALDALMIAPERFIDSASVFLGMRLAYRRLVSAQTDDELRDVVDLMWTLALSIEDGEVSLAMRKLREAKERLEQALENGASDEEIATLTEELRQAMNEFFQALAEQARRNPQAMAPMDPNARSLSQEDMQRMLDRIEELAKSGSKDSARQLLSQMQQMMENLQTGRMQSPQTEAGREMAEMLEQLGEMIRRQRELMEQTHRFNQEQQQEGEQQNGQQGQNGERQQQQGQLQQGQGDLQRQLQEMMKRLQELGMQPGQQLGEAEGFMGDAGRQLGKGQSGDAVGSQGNALNALREGADQMIEQMMSQGRGQGPRMGRNPNNDPLGRPRQTDGPSFDDRTKIPGEIDVQEARRILEELRRRLSDPNRPRLELDYLERLIPGN